MFYAAKHGKYMFGNEKELNKPFCKYSCRRDKTRDVFPLLSLPKNPCLLNAQRRELRWFRAKAQVVETGTSQDQGPPVRRALNSGAADMAQSVKDLQNKHGHLSLIPRKTCGDKQWNTLVMSLWKRRGRRKVRKRRRRWQHRQVDPWGSLSGQPGLLS